MPKLLTTATLLAIAAAAIFAAAPATALTLEQAQAELAGMYCDGSKCVSYKETTTVTDLPDIVTSGTSHPRLFPNAIVTLPANGTYASRYDWAKDGQWQKIRTIERSWVHVEDGGTETNVACTRTKKVLTYNGPNTDRANAWSVATTIASLPGNCPAR